MTFKTLCDGPDCDTVVDSNTFIAQAASGRRVRGNEWTTITKGDREFHFCSSDCLAGWAALAAQRAAEHKANVLASLERGR